MDILMTALYNNVKGNGGGSGSFNSCLYNELTKEHNVVFDSNPRNRVKDPYDLIISSHRSKLDIIKNNTSKKLHICHGIVPSEEQPIKGADHYISISPEVSNNLRNKGFESLVVPQPVTIPELTDFKEINKSCQNILIIRNSATRGGEFDFLRNHYNVLTSNINIPISEQIEWADLVITLGRGAIESMSYGRNVLVADNRFYQGKIGDGLLVEDNIETIEYNNFSGRCNKINFTNEWVLSEISKYSKDNGGFMRDYVKKYDVKEVIDTYFTIAGL